jgi:hypothetical protein
MNVEKNSLPAPTWDSGVSLKNELTMPTRRICGVFKSSAWQRPGLPRAATIATAKKVVRLIATVSCIDFVRIMPGMFLI